MNLLRSFYIFFFLCFVVCIHAQQACTRLVRDIEFAAAPGKVTIIQDKEIVKLIDRHLAEEVKNQGITGFRIRIYSNSGRQAFREGPVVQAEFANRYPNVKPYYVFDSPFYLLYVGDFRTHSEAMKLLKEIERHYPDAFIVRTRINYPPL